MCLTKITQVESYLRNLGRYSDLLIRYSQDNEDRSIWFEMVFAYWLEDSGIIPKYEKNVNPKNNKSVDFAFLFHGASYHLELVRVEHSDAVMDHIQAQQGVDSIFHSYGLLISSDHSNPYFRTAAQLIRLQEKILEKVDKFGLPSNKVLSIIIVDCTNIHSGMIDDEDVRIVAFGSAMNLDLQEFWNGKRLKGLFEVDFTARNSGELRKKISAIIFISKLKPGAPKNSYFVVNPAFEVAKQIKDVPLFQHLKYVGQAL